MGRSDSKYIWLLGKYTSKEKRILVMAKNTVGKDVIGGRIGSIQEVTNIAPRLNANLDYYHVRVQDKDKKEFSLLLTSHELKRAVQRALNNPEDLPKVRWLRNLFD